MPDNKCHTCTHKQHGGQDGGHCYMFRKEPEFLCMQHQERRVAAAAADEPTIRLPDLCKTHQRLLLGQARYTQADPWRALLIISTVALFQGASADPRVHKECDGDITQIGKLGCLACRKPDSFGELVEVAKSHDLKRIKELGEKWVQAGSAAGEKP
jgi:hypothetical protein